MTYADSESSIDGGMPIELYRFVGTYNSYFYTSGSESIVFQSNTYVPTGIQRGRLNIGTQEDDNLALTLKMSVQNEMVRAYAFQTAPPKLDLTVYRFHEIAEFVEYWQGPIENFSINQGVATLRSPSGFATALSADFPNVFYQSPCNNTLYDDVCGIDPVGFTEVTTVATIDADDPREFTVAAIGAITGQLVGGEAVLASGERRMIITQVGTTITVNFPFSTFAVSDAITVRAGCDLAFNGDCANRFNNQVRHTGFNFIPPDNVFQDGLEPGQDVSDDTCIPPQFEGWLWEWTFTISSNASLAFYIYDYPAVTGYDFDINDGPGHPLIFSTSGGAGLYTKRMTAFPEPGLYTMTWDPFNFAAAATYSIRGRRWNEATSRLLDTVNRGSGGSPFDQAFMLSQLEITG